MPPKKVKPSATELLTASDGVRAMIVSGATERQITLAIEKRWPTQAARPLIIRCLQDISDSASADEDIIYGWCFEATREIHRRAMNVDDFPTALRAARQMYDMTRDRA